MTGERTDVIQALLNQGTYVNALNNDNKSPLFFSIENNNPLSASVLLKNGADHSITNNSGQTAFELIKEIEDWTRCDFFDAHIKEILKSKLKLLIVDSQFKSSLIIISYFIQKSTNIKK
jgi:ankyrin repeat protein